MTREEAVDYNKNLKMYMKISDKNNPCKFLEENYIALDMAIKALEQQRCEDCISRQAVLDTISELNAISFYEAQEDSKECYYEIRDAIKQLPFVTPQPKIGRWIDIQYFKADDTYYRPKCPFCSIEPKEYSNFCPNCGAKMGTETKAESEEQ